MPQPLQLSVADFADHKTQQQFRIPPDGLLGKRYAARDVQSLRRIGELRLERVGNGVIRIRQVGKHDTDTGRGIAGENMSRPLRRGVDLGAPVGDFHALVRPFPHQQRPVVTHHPARAFRAPEKVGHLRRHHIESNEVQPVGGAREQIGEFRPGGLPVQFQTLPESPCPAPEGAGIDRAGEGVVIQGDAIAVHEPPGIGRQFRQGFPIAPAQLLPEQQFGFLGQEAVTAGQRQRRRLWWQ